MYHQIVTITSTNNNDHKLCITHKSKQTSWIGASHLLHYCSVWNRWGDRLKFFPSLWFDASETVEPSAVSESDPQCPHPFPLFFVERFLTCSMFSHCDNLCPGMKYLFFFRRMPSWDTESKLPTFRKLCYHFLLCQPTVFTKYRWKLLPRTLQFMCKTSASISIWLPRDYRLKPCLCTSSTMFKGTETWPVEKHKPNSGVITNHTQEKTS